MNNGKNITPPQINYEKLVEEALRAVVRSSLRIAAEEGLPGDTHFYITFRTNVLDAVVPERLKKSHPDKMTIVIQHQYRDLEVGTDRFSVTLTFGGIPEKLVIPFSAVVDFNDPSVGFGLQFAHEEEIDEHGFFAGEPRPLPRADNATGANALPFGNGKGDGAPRTAEVVSLDQFRKKT